MGISNILVFFIRSLWVLIAVCCGSVFVVVLKIVLMFCLTSPVWYYDHLVGKEEAGYFSVDW